jgi:hypothetical protein
MIAASLWVGLSSCACPTPMRDGRIYASRNLRATLRADKQAVSAGA